MNILIIGAGGFIGSNLSEEILERKKEWNITAIDISDAKISHLLNKDKFNFIKADIIKETEIVDDALKNCDVVLPLAAIASPLTYVQDPMRVFELDFEANLRIVKQAAKLKKRVIFPSTSEVYGMCSDEAFDEYNSNCVTGPICKQRWIYSCSKQMLDRVIFALGIRDNLQYTLFRPFNWIGPRLDDINNPNNGSSRVVTQFLSNILHGKNLKLVDGGAQIRCFTYISDGVDALIKIIENKNGCANQEIFNVGNPYNELSIKDLAYKIKELAKSYSRTKTFAEAAKIEEINSSEYYGKSYQDVNRRVPSIANAKEKLDWIPQVNMDELLKRTMDFYFK
ncbi:MAG: bifunctional UDP-4-keto-pentose/UDP-xylose synthase [Alphaproteobacteria bacterium]|nr:bifunctional UDP-4-keto-pentose/UDP-xylose synthase [Alphaproteobacteria bacterium]